MPENNRFQKDFDQERPHQVETEGESSPKEKEEVVNLAIKSVKKLSNETGEIISDTVKDLKKAGKKVGKAASDLFGIGQSIDEFKKVVEVGGEITDKVVEEVEEVETSVNKSESRLKRFLVWLAFRGIPITVAVAAIVWIRDKGIELLEKKSGTSLDTIPRTTEEAYAAETWNTQIDFSLQGLDGLLNIEPLTDPQHGNDKSVIDLAAQAGGPAGLLDTYKTAINSETKQLEIVFDKNTNLPIPAISETVFSDISEQLNLDQAGKTELRQIWSDYLNASDRNAFDQTRILNFLQSHGTNPEVIAFYRLAMDLKVQYPDTWQDRIEPLKNWEPKQEIPMDMQGKDEVAGQVEEVEPNENFFSVAEMAWEKIGEGDFSEALGIIETAAHMDFSNPEHQTAVALDIADLPDSKPRLSGFSPLPMVLTGLFLLRISPRIGLLSLPKRVIAGISNGIEDVYYWFRLGQVSRVVRDLVVMGSQFLKNTKS